MEAKVDLAPVMAFVAGVQPNPIVKLVNEKIQEFASNDSLTVSTRIVPRGMVYRMTLEEGILRAIGAAARANAGGGNRGF